jgi:predicted MFS family arabinose efflux permease
MRVLGTILLIVFFWIAVGTALGMLLEESVGTPRPLYGLGLLVVIALALIYLRHLRKPRSRSPR